MKLEKAFIKSNTKMKKLEIHSIKEFIIAQQEYEILTEDDFEEFTWHGVPAFCINIDEVYVPINGEILAEWLENYCHVVSSDSKQIIITGWKCEEEQVKKTQNRRKKCIDH